MSRHTQWCVKCSLPFNWEDNEDEGALPPAVCSRCTIADNTPIPKPFEEALKKINLEV